MDAAVTERSMLVKPTKRKYQNDNLQWLHEKKIKDCHGKSGKGNNGKCFFKNKLERTNTLLNLTKSSQSKILFHLRNKMLSEDSLLTSKVHRLPHFGKLTQKCISEKTSKTTHIPTHNREKPYCCQECGKKFPIQAP